MNTVLHALIDTVSKNGVILLNISPKADGAIPDDQRKVLKGMGAWLKENGEAIYNTRPWVTYGEGPTKEPKGGFKEHKKFEKLVYSAADIRYTQSKDGKIIYATLLDTPEKNAELKMKSFTKEAIGKDFEIKKISRLNSDESIPFIVTAEGLTFSSPAIVEKSPAVCFKIQMK